MSDELENWVSVTEAAAESGYTKQAVSRLARADAIKARRFGRVWAIYLPSLLAYKAQMDALGDQRHDPRRNPTWERSPEAGRRKDQD